MKIKIIHMKKLFLIAATVAATLNLSAQEIKAPEAFRVGEYEVFVLVETSGSGSTSILIDAPEAVLAEYAPGGTFPNATNAVLIRKNNDIWLVDTGYGRNIFSYLDVLGIAPEDVGTVLLTHMHGDHIGGMFRDGKKSFPNADVVVSIKEAEYWSSDAEMNKVPEGRRGAFTAARKVLAEYDAAGVEPSAINAETVVLPTGVVLPLPDGITPIRAYGHTPGHVAYMIKDGKQQLLIWGDLTHAMAVQMPHPEISVTYDVDPEMARVSRIEILRDIADLEKTPAGEMTAVVGMHIQQTRPGVVYFNGSDGYRFVTEPSWVGMPAEN